MRARDSIEQLAAIAYGSAFAAAEQYYKTRNAKPISENALVGCLQSWVRAKMSEALIDAEQAVTCGMDAIALATFRASMMQAGIEAAKEAQQPVINGRN